MGGEVNLEIKKIYLKKIIISKVFGVANQILNVKWKRYIRKIFQKYKNLFWII